tara:strand:- start:58 stop:600 length:543 start_codon:yes stop_codon:yes gene_type:complete
MSNLFLRHGEVQNTKDVFYANLPGFYLSSKGELQAKDAAKKIKKLFNIKKIISSPLLRARQTASIVSEELKLDVEVSYNVIEWSGPYEWIGKTIEEIKLTESFKNYNNNPLNLKNTLETLENVHDRFKLDYEKYEDTLFVSHQDTIRAFTYYYLGEKDFSKNRPIHCELQFIKNKVLNSY